MANFKLFTIPLFTLLLASFNSISVTSTNLSTRGPVRLHYTARQNDSLKAAVAFLLDASAKDFHHSKTLSPVSFRQVRIGYLITATVNKQYILCGEFRSIDKNEWIPFATIQTSNYEQWIGNQTLPFCQNPKITWANLKDLSSTLKNRLDALH
ncbi:hypothetical protein [Spirosoma knui]